METLNSYSVKITILNCKFFEMEIVVHCENNTPFVVATDVVRVIEVSHWGNIAVEEAINVIHKGAELKVFDLVQMFIIY